VKIIKTPYILFLFLIIACVYFFNFIKINKITCKSQYGPCSKEVEIYLEGLESQKLSFVRKNIKTYLKEGLMVVDYTTSYKLPNIYEVYIIERKTTHALLFGIGSQIALVDDDGYILSFVESSSLPIVKTYSKTGNAGDKVEEEALFALKLMTDLHFYYQVNEGEITKDGMKIELNSGKKAIFPLNGDKGILLSSLGLILSKLNSVDDDLKMSINTIDLRFKNPVLR